MTIPVELPVTGRSMLRRAPIVLGLAGFIVAVVALCAILGEVIAPDSPFTQRLAIGDTPSSAEFHCRNRSPRP